MIATTKHSVDTAPGTASPAWCLSIATGDSQTTSPHSPRQFLPIGLSEEVTTAARGSTEVLFEGVIYNRADLLTLLEAPITCDDANLILRAYERFGDEMLSRVKGVFALVLWDAARRFLLAARDPLGVQPLFYAEGDGRLVFSSSPDRIVSVPGISNRLNEVVMASWLCHRWPDLEETFFRAVKRIPPGYVLSVGPAGRRLRRFWDPLPPGAPVDWLTEGDLDRFDPMFSEAIGRALQLGPCGIFLSGGLDSVSVAAVATDLASRLHQPAPLALSLGFPGDECNEQSVQESVAGGLGLDQILVPFGEAAGPQGLLWAALEMGRGWPQPMMNTWNPVYMHLASLSASRGRNVILTGSGGDEWLTVSSLHAADLIGAFDVPGLMQMLLSIRRSYNFSWKNILRATLWKFGVRPWLAVGANGVLPGVMHRSRVRRVIERTPAWVAPDRELRRELDARAERDRYPPRSQGGFYVREMQQSLEDPLHTIEMENAYEKGRRTGAVLRHPFWDPDLIEFLLRMPPRLLNHGGRTKGMVRRAIARRFPALGFERHRKVFAYGFFNSLVTSEGPGAWSRLGGAKTLAALGVVDAGRVKQEVASLLAGSNPRALIEVWNILHLEAWARTWA